MFILILILWDPTGVNYNINHRLLCPSEPGSIAWLADSRLMISYYRSMKQQLGVDRRLQKVQQELDTNVPVLEGTDVKAMVCFF